MKRLDPITRANLYDGVTCAFNKFRSSYTKRQGFHKEQLMEILHPLYKLGVPVNRVFDIICREDLFLQKGCRYRGQRNVYFFKNVEGKIAPSYFKKIIDEIERPIIIQRNIEAEVENAIALLKSHGYKIYKEM